MTHFMLPGQADVLRPVVVAVPDCLYCRTLPPVRHSTLSWPHSALLGFRVQNPPQLRLGLNNIERSNGEGNSTRGTVGASDQQAGRACPCGRVLVIYYAIQPAT